jgi:hypothetical protein
MHGLVNRAIQCFYRDTYGTQAWSDLVRSLELPFSQFEPMMRYDAQLTHYMVAEIARVLDKPREAVLEDLGTYLVSNPNVEALRRLLRCAAFCASAATRSSISCIRWTICRAARGSPSRISTCPSSSCANMAGITSP